jgi:hypothetical protein
MLLKTLIDYLPAPAGTIIGTTVVCQGQNSVTYSVPPITNATSYIWTLPNGATGISSTNSITVNYGASSASGKITVAGENSYGVGVASSLSITVNEVQTIAIEGATQVLVNTNKKYSIQSVVGVIIWSVSGGVITSGQGTNEITVSWGGNAGAGSIEVSVLYQNGCTASKSVAVSKFEAATGPSMALWFDASKITGLNNGQTLPFTAPYTEAHPSWEDISGNGRGAYMLGGNQILIPTYFNSGANTVNSQPAVLYDMVNDALIINNSAAVNAGAVKTLFTVFKTGNDVNAKQVIFESGSGAATHSGFNVYIYGSQICFGVWNGNAAVWINKACTPNTSYLTQLVYDGNTGTLKVSVNTETAIANGVPAILPQGTQYNGLGSSVQGTRMWMGYSSSTIDYPFGGSIAEVLLYNTVSPTVRSQTFSYLNAKYGFAFGGNQLLKTVNSEISDNKFEIINGGAVVDMTEGEYNNSETVPVSLTPNPVRDEAKIRIQSDKTEKVVITIYDMLGQQIIVPMHAEVHKGSNEFSIPTKNILTGSYRVVICGSSIYESAAIVILQ